MSKNKAFKETDEFIPNYEKDLAIRELGSMCVNESKLEHSWYHNIKYLVIGVFFGIVFVKAEIVSWFRIQEMFRLQSFHMYGIIGSAVIVAAISVYLIRKFNIKTIYGEEIIIHTKPYNKGIIIGGLLFGLGWAITGACPGPLYAQIGSGTSVVIITLLSAIAGTWCYGLWRDKLPH
jgi:uncharacterized membrane protein YedE/YeeE